MTLKRYCYTTLSNTIWTNLDFHTTGPGGGATPSNLWVQSSTLTGGAVLSLWGESKMAKPTHVLGVDLLKLILRSKDPFPPRFYCHSCKQKFTIPMKSTSPVSTPTGSAWVYRYLWSDLRLVVSLAHLYILYLWTMLTKSVCKSLHEYFTASCQLCTLFF